MSSTASLAVRLRSNATRVSSLASIMASPPAVVGAAQSLEAHVDSPMATWCSFMMP